MKERHTKNYDYLWDGYGLRIDDKKTKQSIFVCGEDWKKMFRFIQDVTSKKNKMSDEEMREHIEKESNRRGNHGGSSFMRTHLQEQGTGTIYRNAYKR